MYVVLGASGNTGHVVAKNLLARGQKVRVVGRNAARLQPLAAEGAEIFIGDVTDTRAITKAFMGAETAYVMIPPNLTSNDYRSYQERAVDAIATAVLHAGVKHVVSLSSIGADKASGTGPVLGLHDLEQKLNQIDGRQHSSLARRLFHGKHAAASGRHSHDGAAGGPAPSRPEASHDRHARHWSRGGRLRSCGSISVASKPRNSSESAISTIPKLRPSSATASANPDSVTFRCRTSR